MKTPEQSSDDKKKFAPIALLGTGIEFGGTIAVFCYIGYRLDAAMNTSPYLLLTGFFLSFIGMLYLIFKQANNMWRK